MAATIVHSNGSTILGDNGDNRYNSFWRIDFSLYGRETNDQIWGFGGEDALYGLAGDDYLNGGTGADFMNGGLGNDQYVVDNIGDVVADDADLYHEDGTPLNAGRDRVQASISYTLGFNIEELELLEEGGNIDGTGNNLDNKIIGNAGGNDINGGAGADIMSGRGGNDTYRVDNVGDIVNEDQGSGIDSVTVFNITAYTLRANVENLTLSNGVFRGYGNDRPNEITGNGLNNTIAGYAGNDTLTGLDGQDTFLFNTELNQTTNVDTITDFLPFWDEIRLDSDVFDGLLATRTGNNLRAEEFASGLAAQDASDRIIYDRPSGSLFYDPDGTGPQGQVRFARVDAGLNLTANDFFVTDGSFVF